MKEISTLLDIGPGEPMKPPDFSPSIPDALTRFNIVRPFRYRGNPIFLVLRLPAKQFVILDKNDGASWHSTNMARITSTVDKR